MYSGYIQNLFFTIYLKIVLTNLLKNSIRYYDIINIQYYILKFVGAENVFFLNYA